MLARAALDQAIEDATEDLLKAAAEEAAANGTGVAAVMNPSRGPHESGLRPRDPEATRHAQRKVGSPDVERYVREAWHRAITNEERERVRRMARSAIESGVLDSDAGERLLTLMTEAA